MHAGFGGKSLRKQTNRKTHTYERIASKCAIEIHDGGYGLNSFGSGHRAVVDSCEHTNEPLGSITCWEFVWLCNYWLLKEPDPLTVIFHHA
jgi:hypothetical protein